MSDHKWPADWTPEQCDMCDGFLDGYDLDAPEPSANRSASYRHGFANGRDDKAGKPRAGADTLRRMADVAILTDMAARGALPANDNPTDEALSGSIGEAHGA